MCCRSEDSMQRFVDAVILCCACFFVGYMAAQIFGLPKPTPLRPLPRQILIEPPKITRVIKPALRLAGSGQLVSRFPRDSSAGRGY